MYFFLMRRETKRSTRTDTHFTYTTLFRSIKKGGAPGDFALEIVEQRLFRLIGISREDVECSRHLGIDTGKRDQFFISAAQLVFPSYCLDQRCRGGCDQLQGIDWNGHRPARPTKAAELGT